MRYVSVPERLGMFAVAVGAAAVVYPGVARATGLGLPCPLRLLTGMPCPGCGMTTAAVNLVAGNATAALASNPLIFGLAGLALITAPVMVLRATGVRPP